MEKIITTIIAAWYAFRWFVTSQIVCRFFKLHKWTTLATSYRKNYTMADNHVGRYVIRTRVRECDWCCESATVEDRARITKDWQHPERLRFS